MSQETENTEAPAPTHEALARSMGWKPLEEFRGDPEKWVEASEFVSRSEHYLPLIKKDRDRLRAQLEATERRVNEMAAALSASQEAISAFKEYQSAETKRQVERARKELVEQLRAARDSGDVELEAEAIGGLAKIDAAKPTPTPPAPPAPAPSPQTDPEFLAWKADNPWFETDKRKTALAAAIAQELRADPETKNLYGRAFYDRVSEEVLGYTKPAASAPAPSPAAPRVASSRPAGGTSRVAKSYSDLPAEAREACDSFASKLVGPGRAYKTLDDWRAHYTKQYFEE